VNGIRIDPNRLLLERSRRGLSQIALADKAGLAYLTVSRIERGKSPTVQAVTAYERAGALALDVEDLTRGLRPLPGDSQG
jgi:transcriptional regulator with XRE-family HTH domain